MLYLQNGFLTYGLMDFETNFCIVFHIINSPPLFPPPLILKLYFSKAYRETEGNTPHKLPPRDDRDEERHFAFCTAKNWRVKNNTSPALSAMPLLPSGCLHRKCPYLITAHPVQIQTEENYHASHTPLHEAPSQCLWIHSESPPVH